jgi:hypothetical protein
MLHPLRKVLVVALVLTAAVPAAAQRPESREPGAVALDTTALQPPSLPEATVGENVQVSAPNSGNAHFELDATAHPARPGVLLSAGMVRRGPRQEYNVVVYRSEDGGKRWTQTLEVAQEGVIQDPTFAAGAGGVYFGAFGGGRLGLYRSVDGGQSWTKSDLPSLDRPWLSVGAAGAGTEEHLYLHGTGAPDGEAGDSVDVAVYRAAVGEPLSSAEGLDLTREGREMLATGNSAVRPDGTVVFPYLVRLTDIGIYESETLPPPRQRRRPNALLRVAVSKDGGETFATDTVARWYHRFGRGESATMPVLAVDTTDGPFSGRVYVAWTDFRSGDSQVLLSHSDRPGERWSDPVLVNRRGGPAFRPDLAVNTNGILGISFYDRRASESGLGWRARFAASRDGGVTVGPSIPTSEAPYRYAWNGGLVVEGESGRGRRHEATAYLHAFNESGGHTAGLTADATGTFYPFWVDNRTGTPQMWTAPVEVAGRAIRHNHPALSDVEDITGRTALRIEEARYNDSTQVATLRVRLHNVSQDTLRAPMALRLIDLWSEFGEARLAGRLKGTRPHGTVLPIAARGSGRTLAPQARTDPFEIQAWIKNPKTLGPMRPPPPDPSGDIPGYTILRVKAQALGVSSGPGGS